MNSQRNAIENVDWRSIRHRVRWAVTVAGITAAALTVCRFGLWWGVALREWNRTSSSFADLAGPWQWLSAGTAVGTIAGAGAGAVVGPNWYRVPSLAQRFIGWVVVIAIAACWSQVMLVGIGYAIAIALIGFAILLLPFLVVAFWLGGRN